jgi:hypothetical protein
VRPCAHDYKFEFLSSLEEVFTLSGLVAIMGDFSLLRAPRDKSNNNFNLVEATAFNDLINNQCVLEIPLLDRQVT